MTDRPYELILGDCVDEMGKLGEASVDAIVCDPPYGLEFMGKAWDSFRMDERSARWSANSGPAGSFGESHAGTLPSYGKRRSTHRCSGCGKRDAFRNPHDCTEDAEWRPEYVDVAPVEMRAFQNWCHDWALEAFRVLKPGGHLLAFGGTRTYHRMAVAVEDAGFEIRDSLHWIYGSGFPKSHDVSKAIDKAEGAERDRREPVKLAKPSGSLNPSGFNQDGWAPQVGEPVTAAAAAWNGWGTALKPSVEVVVVGRKPSSDGAKLRASLCRLSTMLLTLLSARVAAELFGCSTPDYEEACASAQWTADERASTQDALLDRMDTSQFESATITSLSTVLSWLECSVDLLNETSTSTTETGSRQTTDLRTLCSLLSEITPRSIIEAETSPGGSTLSALPVARAFAAARSRSNATRELSALARATALVPISLQDEGDSPHEPIVLARKPLVGSVAGNVMEHGTGALNTLGCAVGTEPGARAVERPKGTTGATSFWHYATKMEAVPEGRWPANLLLSHLPECEGTTAKHTDVLCAPGCPVAELNEMSGESASAAGGRDERPSRARPTVDFHGGRSFRSGAHHGDAGGAARFFYIAKPRTRERIGGTTRNLHPTVKPVELMRWLVRLVTPPGGLVLDPFLGSGSTGCAAMVEGFRFLGIEKDPESFETAGQRIADWAFAHGGEA